MGKESMKRGNTGSRMAKDSRPTVVSNEDLLALHEVALSGKGNFEVVGRIDMRLGIMKHANIALNTTKDKKHIRQIQSGVDMLRKDVAAVLRKAGDIHSLVELQSLCDSLGNVTRKIKNAIGSRSTENLQSSFALYIDWARAKIMETYNLPHRVKEQKPEEKKPPEEKNDAPKEKQEEPEVPLSFPDMIALMADKGEDPKTFIRKHMHAVIASQFMTALEALKETRKNFSKYEFDRIWAYRRTLMGGVDAILKDDTPESLEHLQQRIVERVFRPTANRMSAVGKFEDFDAVFRRELMEPLMGTLVDTKNPEDWLLYLMEGNARNLIDSSEAILAVIMPEQASASMLKRALRQAEERENKKEIREVQEMIDELEPLPLSRQEEEYLRSRMENLPAMPSRATLADWAEILNIQFHAEVAYRERADVARFWHEHFAKGTKEEKEEVETPEPEKAPDAPVAEVAVLQEPAAKGFTDRQRATANVILKNIKASSFTSADRKLAVDALCTKEGMDFGDANHLVNEILDSRVEETKPETPAPATVPQETPGPVLTREEMQQKEDIEAVRRMVLVEIGNGSQVNGKKIFAIKQALGIRWMKQRRKEMPGLDTVRSILMKIAPSTIEPQAAAVSQASQQQKKDVEKKPVSQKILLEYAFIEDNLDRALTMNDPFRWMTERIRREIYFGSLGEHPALLHALVKSIIDEQHVPEFDIFLEMRFPAEPASAATTPESIPHVPESQPEAVVPDVPVTDIAPVIEGDIMIIAPTHAETIPEAGATSEIQTTAIEEVPGVVGPEEIIATDIAGDAEEEPTVVLSGPAVEMTIESNAEIIGKIVLAEISRVMAEAKRQFKLVTNISEIIHTAETLAETLSEIAHTLEKALEDLSNYESVTMVVGTAKLFTTPGHKSNVQIGGQHLELLATLETIQKCTDLLAKMRPEIDASADDIKAVQDRAYPSIMNTLRVGTLGTAALIELAPSEDRDSYEKMKEQAAFFKEKTKDLQSKLSRAITLQHQVENQLVSIDVKNLESALDTLRKAAKKQARKDERGTEETPGTGESMPAEAHADDTINAIRALEPLALNAIKILTTRRGGRAASFERMNQGMSIDLLRQCFAAFGKGPLPSAEELEEALAALAKDATHLPLSHATAEVRQELAGLRDDANALLFVARANLKVPTRKFVATVKTFRAIEKLKENISDASMIETIEKIVAKNKK